MHDYPEAYTTENLKELIDANDSCPTISLDETERIVDLARRRADARGEESSLEETETDCLVATDWAGFAQDEFGYDNGDLNEFAIGVYNHRVSMGRAASLFTDTYVIQRGWLSTGDGRRNETVQYHDEDFGSDPGTMWIPKSAQDYLAIIALSDELVHGTPGASEAM